ncbi:hypothetical protein IC007_2199 [Sulfuracidifex tepidarius]|uniref:Uncharacterized protein n=1 Tax=Sulfuracidifex tepidarius TaxID=1294262 RepID=A0A510E529_9CREN|nr:hypothetical protein IC007_2199 [Sulfuracidifex tepidarius]
MTCEKWIFRLLVKEEMDRIDFIKWLKKNFPTQNF